MTISILLTILLMIVPLSRTILFAGKICLSQRGHINDFLDIKYNLLNSLSHWVAKLIMEGPYMLNRFKETNNQKGSQSILIQLPNHKSEG